jgi:hypothetical protein
MAMPNLSLILACGSIRITPAQTVIILALAACWLAACILCLVNPVIIFRTSRMRSFRLTHCLVWLCYMGLGTFLFCLSEIFNNRVGANIAMVLAIAVPLIVIGHFFYLLKWRRRLKGEQKTLQGES